MRVQFGMIPFVVCVALVVSVTRSRAEDAFQFPVESNLRGGVAKVDITPPAETPVVGHVRPTNGVRDPIRAGVLLLANEQTQAAIVTLDLISASSEMVAALRDVIAQKTAIPRENILVAASHNHSGPGWSRESAWSREMVAKIGAATAKAVTEMRPVSVGYGERLSDRKYGSSDSSVRGAFHGGFWEA